MLHRKSRISLASSRVMDFACSIASLGFRSLHRESWISLADSYPSKLELNLGSISLQSRTQQLRHHEDCNYKKRLYISRQSDSLTRRPRFTRSLSQLMALPLALSRFAQSTFKGQHQHDFNTGKQRVSHGTQLQGLAKYSNCGPLAENSNRLRPCLQLCANEARSLASTES